MSDLLQKIKLGTSNTKLLSWPGSETKVLMKILSQQEIQEATFATERLFKKESIDVNIITGDTYEQEQATQILFKALRDPENIKEPVAKTITEFRAALSREEKAILIEEYNSFEAECSPSPDNMSNENFDKMLSDLKKNASQTLLSVTSLRTAKKLITTLVSQLQISQTPSGPSS